MSKKERKMTLKSYYEGLERPTPPKKEFIHKVAERCMVDPYTVRLWVNGRVRPSKDEYYDVLSEVTGIDREKLFGDE